MMTVLTVDDSATIRALLFVILSQAGYAVIQAEDGVRGLEALTVAHPDVIITDINMPRMDGFGFIAGVRGLLQHRFTPILVLSTEDRDDKIARGEKAGASRWLSKPFDAAQLIDAVAQAAVSPRRRDLCQTL